MKIFEIVFSPTGGTEKVAKIVANELNKKVITLNMLKRNSTLDKNQLTKDDVAVISVPSYGGRVPSVVSERLSLIQGNGARAILVCVYGNRAYEDTLAELEDLADKAGFKTVAAISAIAEHSIVRQYASGRPDTQDKDQLIAFTKAIKKKLEEKDMSKPQIPGNRPYKVSKLSGLVPKPTKKCVNCKVCATECPMQAIDFNDPSKIDKDKCISCMRCISVCTYLARSINIVKYKAASAMLKKVCSDRKENELFI